MYSKSKELAPIGSKVQWKESALLMRKFPPFEVTLFSEKTMYRKASIKLQNCPFVIKKTIPTLSTLNKATGLKFYFSLTRPFATMDVFKFKYERVNLRN